MTLNGTLLQVAQLGQPVLRKRAKTVTTKLLKTDCIQQLIASMIATVKDVDGVGIAAPQVYQSHRIFIVASHPNNRYPNAPEMEPTAIVNPVIKHQSKTVVTDWEGCLSIPGLRGMVARPKIIEVDYLDAKGNRKSDRFSDFIARIFQHEFDHLEGIVFPDRMKDMSTLVTEKEYQRLLKK